MAMNHAAPVRRSARLDQWNEIVGDTFRGCVVDADRTQFDGRLATHHFGTIGLVRIKAQPSRVRRWQSGMPPKRSGSVFLHLQVGGTGVNIQSGREITINPGCAALCDPDRGYGVDFVTPYELFVLDLPLSSIALAHPAFDLDRAAGLAIDPHRSKLLISFMRTAWSQLDLLATDADWRDCIDRVGLDLALHAIGQSIEPCASGAPAGMYFAGWCWFMSANICSIRSFAPRRSRRRFTSVRGRSSWCSSGYRRRRRPSFSSSG